jgi:hypothetical protein
MFQEIQEIMQAITEGRTDDLLREHDECDGLCPVRAMVRDLSVSFGKYVEAGLIDWLRGVSHEPACGRDHKGDLVRWITIQDHRLPTIRVDLVDAVCERKVLIRRDAERIDLVELLAAQLCPEVRLRLAANQAALT